MISSRRFLNILIAILLILPLFAAGGSTQPAYANGHIIPGQYIITLDPTLDVPATAADMAQAYGIGVGFVYQHALRGFSATIPEARLAKLQGDPRVFSIQPDRVVTIQGKPAVKPTPAPVAQTLPTGIDRIEGELSSALSGDGKGDVNVDVAVIDTGIDIDHPDLNVVDGYNCQRGKTYDDGNGHGTHVAGTIGAIDNTIGVVGVAPGARLWAVRVLDSSGSGTWSSVICGIDWVTANAATIEVANMSLGGTGSEGSCNDNGLHEAICNSVAAGVTYAVAAGNESDNAANHVPAAYDEVITVSALADFDGLPGGLGAPTCRADEDDSFADFSNYGADVDIIAPGVCIYSTWKGGGYNTISGTSMATPHVAGAAALYLSTHSGVTPAQVKSALQAAGTTDWDNSDDRDNTKEKLLNVNGL